jgi:hopanoid biosynthesis associated protein HpnK
MEVTREPFKAGDVSRLIVNADDFGRSRAINAAVGRAVREGILTTASLMVAGDAAEEAVEIAREHSNLGVGLHLTLCCGQATVARGGAGQWVDEAGRFDSRPVRTGWRYFFNRSLMPALRQEIGAQFNQFRKTGLVLDHVNGHLHFHLHPTVMRILVEESSRWGIRAVRLTREPWWFNGQLTAGRWRYRLLHGFVFALLARWATRRMRGLGWQTTDAVFGLLQDSRVDESFLLRLLERLPRGCFELYAHPSMGGSEHELRALTSERVKFAVKKRGIELLRYQDL